MRVTGLIGVVLMAAAGVAAAQQGPAQFSDAWYQQFRGAYSAPVEPFKIVGNIHYVGGANIASYLITTPQGHILIDTGMKEMHEVIKTSVATLGFKTADIKIMLSSHAHFDHIEGHADDAEADGRASDGHGRRCRGALDRKGQLRARRHRLGAGQGRPRAEAWRHRIAWRNDATRAVHTPGHTQGATTWITTVEDNGRRYTVGFLGGTTPNGGVALFDNPRHKSVVEDTQRTFSTLKGERPPDIYLVGHPQAMFMGKVERIKAGDTPHPLLNGDAWTKQIVDGEANFAKRVAEERAKRGK